MHFGKMHGAGNDFIVFTAEEVAGQDLAALARSICHRQFGMGANGILVAAPSDRAEIRMIYYNSDGSLGEMCGNGLRCFSRMAWERGLVARPAFRVETGAGILSVVVSGTGDGVRVRAGMGLPGLRAEAVPATVPGERVWDYPATVGGWNYQLYAVRMGVPHAVVFLDQLDPARVESDGPLLETLPIFPAKANINFVRVAARDRLEMHTWERGAGHTLACGTGACASVWLAHERGLVDRDVQVQAPGGTLRVELTDTEIYLEGEARWVCEGTYLV